MIGLIISLLIIGLFAGFLARAIVPGNDHLSISGTILLGIVGSFVGGFISWLIGGHHTNGAFQTSGLIGSVIGAIIALVIYNKATGRKKVGYRR